MSEGAIDGESGAYAPCNELASPFPADPDGAISGSHVGFVPKDMLASPMPDDPTGAITGSGVGFVAGPCECTPVGNAEGVFRAVRLFTPATSVDLSDPGDPDFPPRGPTITNTSNLGGHPNALAARGNGSEVTIQYTVPALMTVRVNIEVYVFLSTTVNNVSHPRCFTNIAFTWELRRAHWGASFAPTYDDFQLDPNGSILGGGVVTPTAQICYPFPTFPAPTADENTLHLLSYTDDLTGDADGMIQFQLRISDLNAAAAAVYNNNGYGSGFFDPVDDDWLYSHSTFYTTVTVCEP